MASLGAFIKLFSQPTSPAEFVDRPPSYLDEINLRALAEAERRKQDEAGPSFRTVDPMADYEESQRVGAFNALQNIPNSPLGGAVALIPGAYEGLTRPVEGANPEVPNMLAAVDQMSLGGLVEGNVLGGVMRTKPPTLVKGIPGGRPRVDPQEAPRQDIGGGGRSNKGGVWVGGRFADEKYYPGGTFLPQDLPSKSANAARSIAKKAATRWDVWQNVSRVTVEPSSSGSGYWVRAELVGGKRPEYLHQNPLATKAEADALATTFIAERAGMYERDGLAAHPTELLGVDSIPASDDESPGGRLSPSRMRGERTGATVADLISRPRQSRAASAGTLGDLANA